jgi:hypothetical protein
MCPSCSDGQWSPEEAAALAGELRAIAAELAELPPQPLLDRLVELARTAVEADAPILFQ